MRIFAIADTHLSGDPPQKPMALFGEHWCDHWEKIKQDWLEHVTADDFVLIAGDISWAMKLNEAQADLEAIAILPGTKILIRGNHDYWWQTLGKMNRLMGGRLIFLHNTFAVAGSYAICGSRGWICPEDPTFSTDDRPIYDREVNRLEQSLASAKQAGYKQIIVMLHYPPLFSKTSNPITELLTTYGVDTCVFGHLHGEAVNTAYQGLINDVNYHLVACDALDFKLKRII
jgi:predicted phosphohydrolase